ncbi:F0F1 ATP synthase subunit B [Beduini massiliensis]|uniref:F0F1 ATP synthase subunit B n=1 Tax=Beduini massiliensis TaxID=1585974 RepID=UPI00059A909F|nr:F0F1 ATP synthase subunit B [Beduini massiliensis]
MDINIAGKLFPNITTLIVQLCSTGIMLLVFKKYLWSTIREYMAKRAEAIEGNITEARQMNEQAKVFVQESEQQAREAAKEYRATIQKAKEDAAKVKEGILAEAAQEAKIKIEQADREIEAEKLKAKEEMKQEIIEVAFEVAEKVMNKEVDEKTNKDMVDEFIDDLVN